LEVSQGLEYFRFEGGQWRRTAGAVVREDLVRLHVNGGELARLMCTPQHLDWLALGFLLSEGIITGMADVRLVTICPSGRCIDVWLRQADFQPPTRWTITSGCGGGITFTDLSEAARPLVSELRVRAEQLSRLMRTLQETQETRGIHTSALADGESLMAVVEDVGRHNTIDKLLGRCLIEGIPTRDRVLLSTGRISSEMLQKAARAGIPVVFSRTSPTSLSVALAEAWNVTLVGYVRRDSLNVYTGQARVVMEEATFDANV
jgi:FdhD protein